MKRCFPLPPVAWAGRAENQAQNLVLVWIQCKGYRCMAYQNSEGEWINFYTGKKLADFIKVIG